jgi:hypothetical protein
VPSQEVSPFTGIAIATNHRVFVGDSDLSPFLGEGQTNNLARGRDPQRLQSITCDGRTGLWVATGKIKAITGAGQTSTIGKSTGESDFYPFTGEGATNALSGGSAVFIPFSGAGHTGLYSAPQRFTRFDGESATSTLRKSSGDSLLDPFVGGGKTNSLAQISTVNVPTLSPFVGAGRSGIAQRPQILSAFTGDAAVTQNRLLQSASEIEQFTGASEALRARSLSIASILAPFVGSGNGYPNHHCTGAASIEGFLVTIGQATASELSRFADYILRFVR